MKKIITSIFIGLLLTTSIVAVNAAHEEAQSMSPIDAYPLGSFDGYTLFSPIYSRYTYLINNSGKIVNTWKSEYTLAGGLDLLENGCLLRTCAKEVDTFLLLGGKSGRIEMYDWNGTLVWEFEYAGEDYCMHHDIEILPNGNILVIVWAEKTASEAIKAGCNPYKVPRFRKIFGKWYGSFYTTYIMEVEPTFPSGGNIIWEWHAWDHMIQDYDSTKENYGIVADHPELFDINYRDLEVEQSGADIMHINSIDYNEEFDQILLGVRALDEIWIIDHNTNSDILYRWGNPQVYRAGNEDDQKLFKQHSARWIEPGYPGEGHITIYNNGLGRPDGEYSSIEEIIPPVDNNGNYYLETGSAYGPENSFWSYTADNPTDFYSSKYSSAQRLPNGNTLICEGEKGFFFEVTSGKKIVWEYTNNYPIWFLNDVFKTQRYPLDYPGIGPLPNNINIEASETEYATTTTMTTNTQSSQQQNIQGESLPTVSRTPTNNN